MSTGITTETHGQLACLNWQTLSDERAAGVRPCKEIRRAAIIVTGKCNFACPYCQTLGGDRAPPLKRDETLALLTDLISRGLQELRLSGGEPTLVPWLPDLVALAHQHGVRVAVSSNGYSPIPTYEALVKAGVAEFSISLDSVDPDEADKLSGGRKHVLERVECTIRAVTALGAKVYIGMTCCASKLSAEGTRAAVERIAALGATDIKIMSIAQEGGILDTSWLSPDLADRFPFLAWRATHFRQGRDVRGLCGTDCAKCALVLDDVTIAGDKHYLCNVYFREGGQAIGPVADGRTMLEARAAWYETHDSQKDPICSQMCMDLLVAYNNRVRDLQP